MNHRLLLLFALPIATPAFGQNIPILNPSFEQPVLADGAFIASGNDWGFTGTNAGTFNPSAASYATGAPQGDNVAYIENGALIQGFSEPLRADRSYRLRFAIGSRTDNPVPTNAPLTVSVFGSAVRTPEGLPPAAFQTTVFAPAAGTFQYVDLSFQTNSGTPGVGLPMVLRVAGNASPSQFNVDDFSLSAGQQQSVPVDHPLALLTLIGLLLVGGGVMHSHRRG